MHIQILRAVMSRDAEFNSVGHSLRSDHIWYLLILESYNESIIIPLTPISPKWASLSKILILFLEGIIKKFPMSVERMSR